jgi:hypothetical protein
MPAGFFAVGGKPGGRFRMIRPAIWAELRMAPRERMGREASPSAAVLDSQSVKSAEKGQQSRCGGL